MRKILLITILALFAIAGCAPNMDDLFQAIEEDNIEKVEEILKSDLDLRNVDKEKNPLRYAAIEYRKKELTKLLLKYGADVNVELDDGKYIVFPFLFDKDMVEFMIDYGVDFNVYNSEGQAPIHLLAEYKGAEIIKILAENEANIDMRDKTERGFTPFMVAIEKGNYETVKALIEAGANVRAPDNQGDRPHLNLLPWEMRRYNKKDFFRIAEYLVEHGVNVNEQDRDGVTPLHVSVRAGQLDVVKFLLEHGADPCIRDNVTNMTPIGYVSFLTKTYDDTKIAPENFELSDKMEELLKKYAGGRCE